MSLKINVIYDGIIYRVKGMKVLCSVVLAVIILLVAIVGMGVWMLVTVYDEDKLISYNFNSSQTQSLSDKLAPSIDFNSSPTTKIPINNKIETTTRKRVIQTTTARKRVIQTTTTERRKIAPEPNLAVFGADLYDFTRDKNSKEEKPAVINEAEEKFIPSRRIITLPDGVEGSPPAILNENYDDISSLPEGLIPENIYRVFEDSLRPEVDIKEPEIGDYPEYPQEELIPEKSEPLLENDEALQDDNAANNTKDFSRRKGPAEADDDDLAYVGPPVVGYGSHPYKRLSKEKLENYDSFWKNYGGRQPEPLLHPSGNSPIEPPNKRPMRPHLRGLRPTEEEQDIPVRPDAQVPSRDPSIRPRQPVGQRRIPPYREAPRRPPPPPIVHKRIQPPRRNPNRKIFVGTQPPSPPRIKMPPRPSGPVMGPLQELYDYSKRLAASLLSFNMKSDDQIKATTDKMAEHGVKLLEDYNSIFKLPKNGPLGVIASLLPSTERLRTLDPFELSLVTWTFLDFWEFLIEKVGTLSDEDLEMLQERLDRLRKRKDSIMTKALVNETISNYSPNTGRSNEEETGEEKYAEELVPVKEPEKSNLGLPKENQRSLNFTADDQSIPSINVKKIKSKINANILSELFPHLSLTHENTSSTTTLPIKENFQTELETSSEDNTKVSSTSTTTFVPEMVTEIWQTEGYTPFSFNNQNLTSILATDPYFLSVVGPRSARMWDPLGLFSSEGRMQFMQFAVKVVFNFGKVYLKKPYALDCLMLLFCKDLNQSTNKPGIDGMAAKLKSVGLKVLTESDKQLRETDTFHEIWRSVTAWSPLQCDAMFPRCDGSKALEIVNEVALGSNN